MGSMSFAVVLSPGSIIAWLLVGLIAGWLAGLMMKGSGYGIIGDIVVGLIGSFLGGLHPELLRRGDGRVLGQHPRCLRRRVRFDRPRAGDQRAPGGPATVMEINVMERLAMDRFGLSVDTAAVQVKLSRQPGQWISSRGPECHSACRVRGIFEEVFR